MSPRGFVSFYGIFMKVVHVITGLSTGGAERALYNVLTGFFGQLDSAVISLSNEGTYGSRIRELGVPVYTLGMRSGLPSLSTVLKLRSLIRQLQPDVIQGWMYHGNLAAWLARRFAPARSALAWNIRHSLYSLEAEKKLTQKVIKGNRRLSGSVDALLYNSHLSRKQHENFGFCAERGQVIPNGFDLNIWKPRSEHEKQGDQGSGKDTKAGSGYRPCGAFPPHEGSCHLCAGCGPCRGILFRCPYSIGRSGC